MLRSCRSFVRVASDAVVEAELVLVALLDVAFLRTPVGHFLLDVMWSMVVEPGAVVLYLACKHAIGPWFVKRLSRRTRSGVRAFLCWTFDAVAGNLPAVVSTPLRELATVVLVEAVEVRCGPEAKDDVETFLRIGTRKRRFRQLAVKKGSGRGHDIRNRYFPSALARGPIPSKGGSTPAGTFSFVDGDDDEVTVGHCQIAQTLLFMSEISYRDEKTIRECMAAGMFPAVQYYASGGSGAANADAASGVNVFVAKEWAAVVFRATEARTVREFWASAVLEETARFAFDGDDSRNSDIDNIDSNNDRRVRRRDYLEMLKVSGGGANAKTQRYEVRPPIRIPSVAHGDATVIDVCRMLHREGVKLYVTGHSVVGGSRATLFGAYLKEHLNVPPAAVVTFGSPPVSGNRAFTTWYNESVKPSWRFVNRNEVGPMSPPFPFMIDDSCRFSHVGTTIDAVTDLLRPSGSQRSLLLAANNGNFNHELTYEEVEDRLEQLAAKLELLSLLYDHNPVIQMRQLQVAYVRAEQSMSSI